MSLLIAEIVVGVLVVITVAAIVVAARSDDREASAKLDLLCAEFVKARDENIVLVDALTDICNLGQRVSDAAIVSLAQQALARVGKASIRPDRYDVTPQPGRRNA